MISEVLYPLILSGYKMRFPGKADSAAAFDPSRFCFSLPGYSSVSVFCTDSEENP